jgi:outer membrane protein assembly factor BamB
VRALGWGSVLSALCIALSSCSGGLFYGGQARVGSLPPPPLSLIWQQRLDAPPQGNALDANPLLLQMSTSAALYAYDLWSGERLGKRRFDDGICGKPVGADDLLLFGTRGKKPALVAWDRREEETRWHIAGVFCLPSVARRDTLFVVSERGALRALDMKDGAHLWERALEGAVRVGPSVEDGRLFIGDGAGRVLALRVGDGSQAWRDSLDGAVRTRPLVGDGHLWVGTASGEIASLNAATGQVQWRTRIGGLPTPALGRQRGVLAVGSVDRMVYGLDEDSGTLRWTFATEGVVRASPAGHGGVFYIASSDGHLYALDARQGQLLWKFRLDGPVWEDIALVGETLVVATEKKTLYVFGRR